MEKSLRGIFQSGYEDFHRNHGVSRDQHTAAHAIMTCCTEETGTTEWICPEDNTIVIDHHCCRHRSCPRCHAARTKEWLATMEQRLLPCDHFHLVFTLPHELNALWSYNRRWCSDHLMRAGAETLQQLLRDERHLGAEVGIIAALHTWGRTLSFHPHVHLLVSGGGLKGTEWKGAGHDYLLPVAVIKAKFRGKWLAWLNEASAEGALSLPPDWDEARWLCVLRDIAKSDWNVRIQGAYRQGQGVAAYLARYARGGPMKDYRLVEVAPEQVAFRYHSHQDGREHIMRLDTERFIARVLWHVPPKGQHTVRYYGLYVPNAQAKRNLARDALGEMPEVPVTAERRERSCPRCGHRMWLLERHHGKISSNSQAAVQQYVEAAATEPESLPGSLSERSPPSFFDRLAAA
ncbi:MAG: transposase [Pseudomonadota bacterium]|nr:transposase [Pseudomonadota bacterium]